AGDGPGQCPMRKPRSQRPMKAGRCRGTTTIQPEAYRLSQWLNFRTNRQANRKQLLSLLFFNYCRYAPNRLESCAVETLFGPATGGSARGRPRHSIPTLQTRLRVVEIIPP